MVIVPMQFESNAAVAHQDGAEHPRMRNRLLVLANGPQESVF
jgi:hypothetical protein